MRKAMAPAVILILLSIMSVAPAPQGKTANLESNLKQISTNLSLMDRSHESYREAAQRLAGLYAELSRKADSVVKASGAISGGRQEAATLAGLQAAIKDMQQAQTSFNAQYTQLQRQMQEEDRRYTTESNVLKTRHDTVKNSINNVR